MLNKQVALEKKSEVNKSSFSEDLIPTVSTSVIESTLKPERIITTKKSNPELKVSLSNQESFKRYKIQDTLSSNANDAIMYEVTLGIKDGNTINKGSNYHFNNKWNLFFAKFNNEAVLIITDNYMWGHSFRVGYDNYIKDGPKGIGLHLEQSHISQFKNAMNTNTGGVFEAYTYDDMENKINIKVNKSHDSEYIFLKFETTTNSVENSSSSDDGELEGEFDSFSTIKNFLSEKSFAVKKSDFNNLINIIE